MLCERALGIRDGDARFGEACSIEIQEVVILPNFTMLKRFFCCSLLFLCLAGCNGNSSESNPAAKSPDSAQQTQLEMDSIRNNPTMPADKKQQMLAQVQKSATTSTGAPAASK